MNNLIKHINSRYFNTYLLLFQVIVLSHFAEHVAQIIELYILHWPRKESLGLLGLAYPYLVHSEYLHYAHALFMLVGLYLLSFSFVGDAKKWMAITI